MAYIRYYINDSYAGEIYVDRQFERGEDLLKITEAESLRKFDVNSDNTLTSIAHENLAFIKFHGYIRPKTQNTDYSE